MVRICICKGIETVLFDKECLASDRPDIVVRRSLKFRDLGARGVHYSGLSGAA